MSHELWRAWVEEVARVTVWFSGGARDNDECLLGGVGNEVGGAAFMLAYLVVLQVRCDVLVDAVQHLEHKCRSSGINVGEACGGEGM